MPIAYCFGQPIWEIQLHNSPRSQSKPKMPKIKTKKNKKEPETIEEFLKVREKSRQVNTLTQCFAAAAKKKQEPTKRTVWNSDMTGTEEYNEEKNYGMYHIRYGERPCPGECLPIDFYKCKKCVHSNCGLCMIDGLVMCMTAQTEQARVRFRFLEESTASLRGGAPLDLLWAREQDPVWGSLQDNIVAMEEDITKYFNDIERRVKEAKEKIGWE